MADVRVSIGDADLETGARAGYEAAWGNSLWAAFGDLEARPFPRTTRIRQSSTLTYQYREYRYSFGPGFTAAYPLWSGETSVLLTGGGGLFYSVGDFRGSSREPPHEAGACFEAGVRVQTRTGGLWQILYQYRKLPEVAPHRLALQFGLRLE